MRGLVLGWTEGFGGLGSLQRSSTVWKLELCLMLVRLPSLSINYIRSSFFFLCCISLILCFSWSLMWNLLLISSVLSLLLPCSFLPPSVFLLAQWQGLCSVLNQAGKVTYQVDMHDRRKWKHVFHVNMLKKLNAPILLLPVCLLQNSPGRTTMVE